MRLLDDLLENVQKIVPAYADGLEEGYDPTQLAEYLQPFEARIGTKLPPEYYALYERFAGDSLGLAMGWFFMPLGRAESRLQADADGWHASPDNPDQVRPQSHSSRRIPLADDYGGTTMYLDYDPAPGGTPGQLILIFRDDPTTIYSVAPSLKVFLELILAELVAGRVTQQEEENYLEFACTAGQYETFWKDLSHRWRSPAPLTTTEDQLATLSPLWREKIAQDNDSFTNAQLHRVRTLLVNDNDMLPDLANILLFPAVRTLDLYAHPLTPAHLALVAQTKVAFLTLAGVLPDLTPLARLTTLRTLSLVDAAVESLAFLAALPKLKKLELELIVVPDLRPLASLHQLQELKLENSRQQPGLIPVPVELPYGVLTDAVLEDFFSRNPPWQPRPAEWPPLAVLGPLPRLEVLDVSGTSFSDLRALLAFPKLMSVWLEGCPITDFSAAPELPNGLSFSGNGDFLEGILAVAPDKGFRFGSISGGLTDSQRELWMSYTKKQRAEQ
ncbi:SMI1/KNR4 family protein [Hymenobacter sp. H14-R3]|uniref:SMI1/KNR4 family protein n=1 Tax=Hymenobacter sp. H14-R3 TaxID=3046308 RepID=UPI0024BB5D04|nr:SMI1/KNR4 family protein [Hymenobacter sp. H14-R3]MDJ0367769.1 SMI1/KNR4 family protein [Hymenobacter sp. H14-R3]